MVLPDMQIVTTASELRRQLASLRGRDRIALVPTMGCLHEGHLSLIRKARKLADVVVVSIYVNPLQFGAGEDLDSYPRTFDADVNACRDEGVDLVFHPETLYPEGEPPVSMHVKGLSDCLCGKTRPGHFDGVATVVAILFNLVQPDIAVFGEKDWQQLTIIRRMVNGLAFPVEIVGGETVREADGLAMSSRNRYLSTAERKQAKALHAALAAMQSMACEGQDDASTLIRAAEDILAAAGIRPEYLEIRDAWDLTLLEKLSRERPARAFVAARLGRARLIDNMPLELPSAASDSTGTTPIEEVSS